MAARHGTARFGIDKGEVTDTPWPAMKTTEDKPDDKPGACATWTAAPPDRHPAEREGIQ